MSRAASPLGEIEIPPAEADCETVLVSRNQSIVYHTRDDCQHLLSDSFDERPRDDVDDGIPQCHRCRFAGFEVAAATMRQVADELIINTSVNGRGLFHLPVDDDTDAPLCGQAAKGWYRKPPSAYPPGYYEWCDPCTETWVRREAADRGGDGT
jgi:hypothetical protein